MTNDAAMANGTWKPAIERLHKLLARQMCSAEEDVKAAAAHPAGNVISVSKSRQQRGHMATVSLTAITLFEK
jgi:hypothetical protein